jgi:hypothetical protein
MDKLRESGSVEPVLLHKMKQQHKEGWCDHTHLRDAQGHGMMVTVRVTRALAKGERLLLNLVPGKHSGPTAGWRAPALGLD